METESMLAVIGIVTGLGSIAGVFVAIGREKQARVELSSRHNDLTKEVAGMKAQNEKTHDKLTTMEKDQTAMFARAEDIRARLEDVKREKASVESVEALRESMGRVEGLLHGMERRLDSFMREVLKQSEGD